MLRGSADARGGRNVAGIQKGLPPFLPSLCYVEPELRESRLSWFWPSPPAGIVGECLILYMSSLLSQLSFSAFIVLCSSLCAKR